MAWAQRSVKGYADKEKEASRAYARPGIDTNPRYQALGRIGECAFCLYVHLSPKVLDWGPDCDPGWDVKFREKVFDVKTSTTTKLIWPVTKNHFLEPPKADIFVAAHGRDWFYDDKPAVILLGWIPTLVFIREHKIAPPPDHFDPGTKYMDAEMLRDMRRLRAGFVGYDEHGLFRHYCHCGEEGSTGHGVFLRKDQLGTWFCKAHIPPPDPVPSPPQPARAPNPTPPEQGRLF